jgi:hypothetical protein
MDLFLALLKRTMPDFATFYTNHVAASMHRYWTATFPSDIPDNYMSEEWCKKYENEIDYSMSVLDLFLGKLKSFVDAESYTLLITSSLGQAAIKSAESTGFITITQISKFMELLGLESHEWSLKHAMVPCISVIVDAKKADLFEQNLMKISIDGSKMIKSHKEIAPLSFDRQGDNSFQIFVVFDISQAPTSANFGEISMCPEELGMSFFENQDNVSCTGRHTPFGSLIVYDPLCKSTSENRINISTLDIVPAILSNFDIETPSYMNAPDSGLLITSQRVNINSRIQNFYKVSSLRYFPATNLEVTLIKYTEINMF